MSTHIILATKRTQSSTIPNDTINEEILPKLPAKSLARFKCVSKPFNTLISSPEFIEQHLRRSLNSDDNRLLILAGRGNSNLYSIDVDYPESISKVVSIPLPQTLGEYLSGSVSIVGSVNGLLCIGLLLNDPDKAENEEEYHAMAMAPVDFQHVLINPSTGVYRNVPYDRPPYGGQEVRVRFGFGFDEPNNDYKLVRVTENAVRFECLCPFEMTGWEVSVYSFKQNEWKLVYDEDRPEYSTENAHAGVVLNKHLLHEKLYTYT